MNEPGEPPKDQPLNTPHAVVDELLLLDVQLRGKLVHAFHCQDCQGALLDQLLQHAPVPNPEHLDEDATQRALGLRATALEHWLEPLATRNGKVEIPLLHVLALFELAGNLVEATATRAVLGLFYTDTTPELAEKCLRSALLDSERLPAWLWAFSFASFELCLAQIGEVPQLDLTLTLPALDADDWLRFAWMRTRARLTSVAGFPSDSELSDHEQCLAAVLSYYVRSGSLEEAVLVATDLASSYALRGRPGDIEPLRQTLCDLAQDLEPVDPSIRSALAAFSSLGDSRSFAAAAPIHDCIPSIHRYGERLLVEAAEPLDAPTTDASLFESLRAFLMVRAEPAPPSSS